MTKKRKDEHNRWRNKTVSFRMSPQEAAMLDMLVSVSGYTKQDYIISRLLQRDIVVNGNPRTYKALKDLLVQVLDELHRIESATPDYTVSRTIKQILRSRSTAEFIFCIYRYI